MNIDQGMQIAQWVFNALVATALAYVAAKNRQIASLKKALQQAAEDRIDQKFAARENQCEMRHSLVDQRLAQTATRLERGEGAFDELYEARQKAALEMSAKLDSIKDYIRDHCASKDDLKTLSGRFDGLQQVVARDLAERVMPVRVRT